MPLAAAGIAAGGSILGGITGGKGAKAAAKIQAQAQQAAINEQRNEFQTIQSNEQPYMAAGSKGLGAYLDLLGLGSGGAAGQQSAIANLRSSPLFTSQYDTGADTILQNAAATGGLRGGNTALAESNFGSSLLAQVIQNQLSNLGGLVSVGQAGAAGTNAGAVSTGTAVSQLLSQQGNALASGTLGASNAFQNTLNSLGNIAGRYFGSSNANPIAPINYNSLNSQLAAFNAATPLKF
jgi:hypothetical protein